jgi:hypothetical protein
VEGQLLEAWNLAATVRCRTDISALADICSSSSLRPESSARFIVNQTGDPHEPIDHVGIQRCPVVITAGVNHGDRWQDTLSQQMRMHAALER